MLDQDTPTHSISADPSQKEVKLAQQNDHPMITWRKLNVYPHIDLLIASEIQTFCEKRSHNPILTTTLTEEPKTCKIVVSMPH